MREWGNEERLLVSADPSTSLGMTRRLSSRASVASRGICTSALALVVLATGCLDRTRLNPHCEWVGDTYLPTSLHKWGVFLGALSIFAIATWRQYRTTGSRPAGAARLGKSLGTIDAARLASGGHGSGVFRAETRTTAREH